MNKRTAQILITLLVFVNLVALAAIAARFRPLVRTTVNPGAVPADVITTEQQLEAQRQDGQAASERVSLTRCKRLLSDCRNYCQQRNQTEIISKAASTTCYTQCEQSFRFCQDTEQP